jgi:hypothetical protein
MRIEYHETSMTQVLGWYLKGFKLKKDESIWKHESYCDPSGNIIIKLYIKETPS